MDTIMIVFIVFNLFFWWLLRNPILNYWKINEHIELQKALLEEAEKTNSLLNDLLNMHVTGNKKQVEQQEFTNILLQDLLKKDTMLNEQNTNELE